MNLLRVTLFILSSLLLISCNSTSQKQAGTSKANSNDTATKDFAAKEYAKAKARKARISDIHYQLTVNLTQADHFSATSLVTFQLSDPKDAIQLDLEQANISAFIINDHKIYPRYDGSVFTLSPSLLVSGSNTVEISYSRAYSKEQHPGLVRYIDPIDGEAYLTSNLAPNWSRKWFAAFDQPDLKASYSVNVLAPKNWTVISPMKEQSVTEAGEFKQWQFPTTAKLSPHTYSLNAGPFKVWQSSQGKYPLRLLARQSLNKEIATDVLFEDVSSAIETMEASLGVAYPFAKFDLLLIPKQVTALSMPHNKQAYTQPASLSYLDPNLVLTPPNSAEQQKELMRSVIDDLAAQWFGIMVTANWWDESWLNDSLRSHLSQQLFTQLDYEAHQSVSHYDSNKAHAYEADTLQANYSSHSGTHSGLSSIGPHKGKVSLIRLEHLVNETQFKAGTQNYLKQYAYQNASPADFFASQSLTARRDLNQWQQDWLYSLGVNTVTAEFSCKNNRINEFAIIQSPVNEQILTLREQKIKVGLYTKGRNELHRVRAIDVNYRGKRTEVKPLIGSRCPDLVYPNYLDLGYVKVSLDKRSLETVKTALNQIKDSQLRSMIWQTLWENVSSGSLSLNEYLGIVFINLPQEKQPEILAQVLETLNQSKTDLEQILPSHSSYIKMALKAFEQMSLRKAMVNSDNSQIQQLWFNAYIKFSTSTDAQGHLAKLLAGQSKIKGLTLDQQMRWSIIKQLNRYDHLGSRGLIVSERKRDLSQEGQVAAIAAEVSRPEAGIKRYWLTHIQHDEKLAASSLNIAITNLYPKEQQRLSAASSDQRLDAWLAMDKHKSPQFMALYTRYLLPTQCNYAGIARLEKIMASNALSSSTFSELIKLHHSEQRCVAIKEKLLN
ncbi:aminopeptidase N [Shewanella eurypsychrophilus]|uniref:Aminopeptidase N n=1 Tax=Shewanella eurypsychrophilus TaxID=2593656 RepID=A0ABX6V2D9_9GAMM|nr:MULTISPECIES: aminopeptidase N [Shewanella]QFU21495.1 aminopeptidase N [Shewanella sp. YLB-09]QPG56785.1 aminopeptidase N [Shewanella eurypsychrophilus]